MKLNISDQFMFLQVPESTTVGHGRHNGQAQCNKTDTHVEVQQDTSMENNISRYMVCGMVLGCVLLPRTTSKLLRLPHTAYTGLMFLMLLSGFIRNLSMFDAAVEGFNAHTMGKMFTSIMWFMGCLAWIFSIRMSNMRYKFWESTTFQHHSIQTRRKLSMLSYSGIVCTALTGTFFFIYAQLVFHGILDYPSSLDLLDKGNKYMVFSAIGLGWQMAINIHHIGSMSIYLMAGCQMCDQFTYDLQKAIDATNIDSINDGDGYVPWLMIVTDSHIKLGTSAQILNSMWTLSFIAIYFLVVPFNCTGLAVIFTDQTTSSSSKVALFTAAAISIACVILASIPAILVNEAMRQPISVIFSMQRKILHHYSKPKNDKEKHGELLWMHRWQMLFERLSKNSCGITCANMFRISRTTLLSIISLIMTYLVLILQFIAGTTLNLHSPIAHGK